MTGPLAGIRIIDLTSMIAGPLATRILADQGADVIKVEHPRDGDHTRAAATRRNGVSASFANNNRNKRSITLDLKHPDGLATVLRMIEGADALVQNFRPGVAERIGLGEDAVRAVSPGIVYVSICGFGFDGPYAQKPTYDPLIQALSGLTTIQGGSDEERPRLVRTIVPDKLTAIQASQAITAALLARARGGPGQHVRLSMLDTLIAFLWSSDMGGHTFVGDELETETAQSFIDLIYETEDGYLSVAVNSDRDWAGLARAAGRPDWLEDPRFRTPELRDIHKNERLELTQALLATGTTAHWLERLEAEDVPCAPVLTRRQMIRHPQVVTNGIVVETDHPAAGRLRQARPAARFSADPEPRLSGAPALGADTDAVLADCGFAADEIAALHAAGVTGGRR